MSRVTDGIWTQTEDGERHIVSKCGLYCDTCPAFIHGICGGCPRLEMDDCVTRSCAHRKEIDTCHDCTLDACHHFEAYYERRQMMRRRVKRLMGREKALAGDTESGAGGGCSGGGCGTGGCASGGCAGGGCGSGGCGTSGTSGCSAVSKILERIEGIS